MSKALQIPLDERIKYIRDIPFTISFVIRKRQQIDTYMELPAEKRPPEYMIWEGSPEDLEEWFNNVMRHGHSAEILIREDEVEG